MIPILCRNLKNIFTTTVSSQQRNFNITAGLRLKEILVKQVDNGIEIEAVKKPLDEKAFLNSCGPKFCPECTLNLNIKETDVLVLSQYVRSDGCMLPRRITNLCRKQQRRMSMMVTMAQKSGLLPNLAPPNSKRDPKKRYQWKKYNKYFH